jgi:hypothetical protein
MSEQQPESPKLEVDTNFNSDSAIPNVIRPLSFDISPPSRTPDMPDDDVFIKRKSTLVVSPTFTTASPIGAIRREDSIKRAHSTRSNANGSLSRSIARSLSRSMSIRAPESPLIPYDTVEYHDEASVPVTPVNDNTVYITAVNTASLPRAEAQINESPLARVMSFRRRPSTKAQKDPEDPRASEATNVSAATLQSVGLKLSAPNQMRAFGRRAYSFQKRQWFTNICCIRYAKLIQSMSRSHCHCGICSTNHHFIVGDTGLQLRLSDSVLQRCRQCQPTTVANLQPPSGRCKKSTGIFVPRSQNDSQTPKLFTTINIR